MDVNYKITIGKKSFESGKKDALLDLEAKASLLVPVNRCRIILAPEIEVNAKPEDEVKAELGYDDKLSVIFTGKASSIEQGVFYTRIDALSSFSSITAAYINVLYEKKDAGGIVSDLAGKFKIEKDKVEKGIKFPTYIIGDAASVWEHIFRLSKECGSDFYADSEDKLVFKPYKAAKTHKFEYGVNILNLKRMSFNSFADGVEVYGESPAGQGQGDDASSWFTKKEVKGNSGRTSGKVIRIAAPIARDKSLAKKIADNLMTAYSAKESGEIRVIGFSEIKLGDGLKIDKMPQASYNGTFKPVAIRHRLNARNGFITDISYEKAG